MIIFPRSNLRNHIYNLSYYIYNFSYHPEFIDEEMEAQRDSKSIKVKGISVILTQAVSF